MSGLDLALRNLLVWSVQVGVLALAAAAAGRVAPVPRPSTRLAFGQALLALVVLLPLVQPWSTTAAVVDVTLVAAGAAAGATPAAGASGLAAATIRPAVVVAGALLLVAAARLALLGLRLLRLRRIGRAARPLEPEPWLASLRAEVAPRASFAICSEAGVPATYGVRRPRVLFPPAFASMPRGQQQAVALHELLHAGRGDWLALVTEEALSAVLFFHPAVHWLVDRVRLAREQCVDAEVVRRVGAREAYLESLVDAARAASTSLRAVPAAPFLRQSHLRERVDLLLQEVSMSRVRVATHVAVASLAVLVSVSLSASALPLQSPAAPKAAAKPAAGHVNVADDVTAPSEPKLVHKVNPLYPPDAKNDHVEGVYVLGVTIGKDGAIKDTRLVGSAPTPERLEQLGGAKDPAKWGNAATLEGDPRLADAAIAAVRQWRYKPILKAGRPVEFLATVTVRFKLD